MKENALMLAAVGFVLLLSGAFVAAAGPAITLT